MKNNIFVLHAVFFALFLILVLLSFCIGTANISVQDVLGAFLGNGGTARNIVLFVRLPRTIAGAAGGASLAVSGAIIQSVLRNPLGSPNVIGVNSGALFFLLVSAAFFPELHAAQPLSAFLGAFLTVLLVCALGAKTGGSKHAVILAGVVLNTLFSALCDAVQIFVPDSIFVRSAFRIGSLALVQTKNLAPAIVCIALAFVLAALISSSLDVLALGDESAQSLGINARATRIAALLVSSLLAGASVSFSGMLSFVGLIVPHLVRTISSSAMKNVLPLSALGGANLVLLCDIVARCAFAPYELPVGIFLALLGGVFFLGLLLKGQHAID